MDRLGRYASGLLVLLGALALSGCLGRLGDARSQPKHTDESPGHAASSHAHAEDEAAYLSEIADLTALSLHPDEPLRVVVSTSLLGDVVGQVGGEHIQLHALLEPGADPHTYQFTPRDLQILSQAHLVIVNGFGLEEAMQEPLEQMAASVSIIALSEGIAPRAFAESVEGQEQQAHGDHGGEDPHVWFDPANVMVWAGNAARALAALDPKHAGSYSANAAAYIEELEALDRWIEQQVATLPDAARLLVTDHDSLGYFADRYGFKIVGSIVPAYSTSASASAGELAQLQETIRREQARAVFVGVTVNPNLAARLAQDLGIQLVPLYTGSLSDPAGPAASYIEFMQFDLSAIVGALRE